RASLDVRLRGHDGMDTEDERMIPARIAGRLLRLLLPVVLLAGCGESSAPTSSNDADEDADEVADIVTRGPLISGTSSWVDGVFAWTDYAYDDRAANAAARYPNGVYPSDALANAADLIQLQLSLDDAQLTIRAV